MGRWIGRITSPLTGRVEATSDVGFVFDGTDTELSRWSVWWKRTNLEHLASFYLLCVLSLALLCLITYSLLGVGTEVGQGFNFIRAQADALDARFGRWAFHAFVGVGVAVLFSTELALLDAVTRVLADLLRMQWFRGHAKWTLSKLYFTVLWSLIAFGIVVLVAGFNKPLLLLILSASLNAFVMFIYSGLLLWLNLRVFSGPLRPSPMRIAALLTSLGFFGYFSAITIHAQLQHLL